jgi:hypothetical protein
VLLGWDAERRALVEQLRRVGLPVTVVVMDGADEPEPDDGEIIGLDVRDLASGLGRLSLG